MICRRKILEIATYVPMPTTPSQERVYHEMNRLPVEYWKYVAENRSVIY